MHHLLRKLLAVTLGATVGVSALAGSPTPQSGVVRVKLQAEVAKTVGKKSIRAAAGKLTTEVSALDASLKKIKGVELRPCFPANPKYAAERAKYGIDQWYEVVFDKSVDSREAARILNATAGVERANVKVPIVLYDSQKYRLYDPSKDVAKASTSSAPFNDPRLTSQWHYYNDGSMNGSVAGSDINLWEAWKVTTGSPDVIVAIVDGGIDVTHEDLAQNIFINDAELNGSEGVDNDGNGYIDDIYGWNFCTNSATIYPHSHGTHVAGTVAAVNNNGIGVCGVAGGDGTKTSGVRLLSCQVFDSRSGTSDGDFAAALIYAAERGATIAQCSWGWSTENYYEQDVIDAIHYFTQMARNDNMTGGLCVFAAGNDGATGLFYPGCLDEVLTVGAMSADKTAAYYSNYGSWVDVMAPGGLMDSGDNWGVLSTLPNDTYGWNEGTSMACPHVSGIAALVLSKYGKKSMTPEILRNQIQTTVNDFYTYNPGKEGLYGSGYVDAAKALQFGDESAPSRVTDLTTAPAQDNITVEWTIPASAYNNVYQHIIYYSTEEFDGATLDKATSVVVDTKFASSGDKMTYVLENLSPMTKYYIAIKAVNRYGVASQLSEVVSDCTNAGPNMTVDKSSLTLKINNGAITPASFNIGNTDEGLLKWSYRATTAKSSITARAFQKQFSPVAYSGNFGSQLYKANRMVTDDSYVSEDYPKTMAYYESLYARIGDTDLSVPNSMAQNFTVDASTYPDGFNLTAVNFTGANGKKPTIEIYRGSASFNESNLLCSFTPSSFYYGGNIALPEQFKFEAGESFWVVAHFAAENQDTLYPLGIAEGESVSATNSLMSNDLGKTWSRLSDVLSTTSYKSLENATWAVKAVSVNPDWSEIMTLTPSEGTVKQNETQAVEVSTDGTPMCNGSYTFNIYFDTNESQANSIKLPVSVTVTGMEPELKFNKVVDFGSLLVGQSKTLTVEVFNSGYGYFSGSAYSAGIYSNNIKSSNENFSGPDYLSSGFPARSTTQFDITFTPKTSGSHSGYITFTDKNKREFKVMVQGVATDPAKINIDPSTVEVGTLYVGGPTEQREFSIVNTGSYPLQYVFPKFSDETIEGASESDVHKFGYVLESNVDGDTTFEYDNNPALVDATDITTDFNDNSWWSDAIATGFTFPYYGKEYSEVYITSFGGIAMKPYDGNMFNWPTYPGHTYVAGTGLISAFGFDLKIGPNTKIQYAKRDGKFVVNFQDILACVYDKTYTNVSFHMTLSPSGDIEVFYDDYNNESVFNSGRGLYLGINDMDDEDPLTYTSIDIANSAYTDDATEEGYRYAKIASGSAFKFVAPMPNIVESVSPTNGLIAPGERAVITATLRANDSSNAGATVTNLIVNSNDLNTPTTFVKFTANIQGDLNPELALGSTSVNFGQVFRTATATRSLTVRNTGRADMTVTGVLTKNGAVQCALEIPTVIAAGEAKDIVITLPTVTEGAVEDVITVITDCGEMSATVTGEVIGCPDVQLSYESVEQTLESGTTLDWPLKVTNYGDEELTYTVTTGSYLSYTPSYSNVQSFGYSYDATVDNSDVKFDWVDIVTNGLGEQNNFTYYSSHDYVAVDIPFEFNYYGEKYNTLYIYNTGFVSFTKRSDEKMWPEPPSDFPEGSIYTNVIAPYWGLHSMDQTKTAGTYHYATDDQMVISFIEYGNSMNLGVDYQLIINKDGSFKFQYKADENVDGSVIFSTFGVAGISDEDANGIRLPDRYIAFGNAVQFNPVVEQRVNIGATSTADIKLVADAMRGEYESTITLTTNVPGKEKIEIPVKLNITGTAAAEFSDDVVVEHPATWSSTDYTDPLVQMGAAYAGYVEIKNVGTAPFTITSVENQGPQSYDDWFDEYSPMFMTFYYGPETDWMTGEPTGSYSWMQYTYSPITVSDTAVKFAVPMLGYSEAWMTPGEYNVPLVFTIDGIEGLTTKTVNVKFVVTNPPAMSVASDEVRVSGVAPTYTGSYEYEISNLGTGDLVGTAYIDLTGVGETDGNDDGGIALMAVAKPKADAEVVNGLVGGLQPYEVSAESSNVLDLPGKDSMDYIRGLYYPAMPGSNGTFNYGSGTTYDEYKAATVYTSPEGGFNVSHIYTVMKIGAIKNADVNVEIISGDDPSGDTVLGSGTYHISSASDATASYQLTVPLKRAVYIPEGQDFTVVVSYPAGEQYPATICYKEESVVADRYLGWIDSYDWFDFASMFKDTYGSMGYIMSCIETTEGHSWVELDASGETFTISPEQSAKLKLNFTADSAPLESDNKAMLVIKTNDPTNQVLNVPVYLSKNGTPVVATTTQSIIVNEGEQAEVKFTVNEPDNDKVTLTLTDNGQVATIESISAEGANITINDDKTGATVEGAQGAISVSTLVSPKFGDAGSYSMTLSAVDVYDQEGSATANYTVQHVNRAPEAVSYGEIVIGVGALSEAVNFEDLFTDADNDELTYSVSVANTKIAQPFIGTNSVIFCGVAEGTTTAQVTATDASGASAVNDIVITVSKADGVSDITIASDLTIYPNPVVETLFVNVGANVDNVTMTIIAMNGQTVLEVSEDNVAGTAHRLDVASLPTGSYVLRVTSANAAPAAFVIVKD